MIIKVLIILIALAFGAGTLISLPVQAQNGALTTMRGIQCEIIEARVNGVWVMDADIARFSSQIMALQGPNLWIGYPTGWAIPGYLQRDGEWEASIELYACGQAYTVWIWRANTTPDTRYVFVFRSMKANCDTQGQHCGNHDWLYDGKLPTTFSIDTTSIKTLYGFVNGD